LAFDLARGVSLYNLLNNFGRVIRRSPDQLPHEDVAKLNALSTPVTSYSFFLSHRWGSPPWPKYIALLMHFFGETAFLGGAVVSACVFFFQCFVHEFPSVTHRHDDFFKLTWDISQYEFYAGMLTAWAIMLFGHRCRTGTVGFLDAVCINQIDADRKQRGIKSITQFVRAADDFVVLWDSGYFTRGWCAFELASYCADRLNVSVSLTPIGPYTMAAAIQVYYSFGFAIFYALWPCLPGVWGFNVITSLAGLPVFILSAATGEYYAEDLKLLTSQLQGFDITNCGFTMETDRATVMDAVGRLYPKGGFERFNNTVRKELQRTVLATFSRQRSLISYRLAVVTQLPALCGYIGFVSSMRHAPLPYQVAYSVYAITCVVALYPLTMAGCMSAAARLANRRTVSLAGGAAPALRWQHFFVGLCTAVLFIVALDLTYYLPCGVAAGTLPQVSEQPWHGVLLSVALNLVIGIASVGFFRETRKGRDPPALLEESMWV